VAGCATRQGAGSLASAASGGAGPLTAQAAGVTMSSGWNTEHFVTYFDFF